MFLELIQKQQINLHILSEWLSKSVHAFDLSDCRILKSEIYQE